VSRVNLFTYLHTLSDGAYVSGRSTGRVAQWS
jgi:hypothetical protein